MTGVQFPSKSDPWVCDVCHQPLNRERPDWGYHGWGKVHIGCDVAEVFDLVARHQAGVTTFHYIPKTSGEQK